MVWPKLRKEIKTYLVFVNPCCVQKKTKRRVKEIINDFMLNCRIFVVRKLKSSVCDFIKCFFI